MKSSQGTVTAVSAPHETVTFSAAERERYQRHLTLEEIGPAGQQKLRAARVLVVGVGGLGSPMIPTQPPQSADRQNRVRACFMRARVQLATLR